MNGENGNSSRARQGWGLGVGALLGALITGSVYGADPELVPTEFRAEFTKHEIERDLFDEYLTQFWDSRDGLPQNYIGGLAFDREGHLWVATWVGLSRFNGMDFVSFDPSNTPELLSETISDVANAPDGGLWVTTHDGIYEVKGREFVRMGVEQGLADDKTYSIAWADDGAMWVCTRSGLTRVKDGVGTNVREGFEGVREFPQNIHFLPDGQMLVFTTHGAKLLDQQSMKLGPLPEELGESIKLKRQEVLRPDAAGQVWFRADGHIYQWQPGQAAKQFARVDEDFRMDRTLLLCDSHGDVWMAGSRLGVLERWSQGRRATIDLGIRHGVTAFTTMTEDASGNLWVGTGQGLLLMKPRSVHGYGVRQGLPHEFVFSTAPLAGDRAAVGTRRWLSIVDENARTITTARIPGTDPNTRTLLGALDGGVWYASAHIGPLHLALDGTVAKTSLADDWRHDRNIHVFYRDSRRRLWVGHGDGAYVLDGSEVRSFDENSSPAIPAGGVRVIQEMSDGSIWMGIRGQGIAILGNDDRIRQITEENGLSHSWVWCLHESPDGVVWAGTFNGLNRIVAGRSQALHVADGLREGMVHTILPDRDGYFWISGLKGVYRIDPAQVTEVLEGREAMANVVALNAHDGLLNAETNGEQQPAGFVSESGQLWIPTIAGVAVIEPGRFRGLTAPAPPVLRRVLMDDEIVFDTGPGRRSRLDLTGMETFPPGRGRMLEIDFAAPGVELADEAQYEVKLTGHDVEWRKLGNQTTARYTNLRPGDYAFEVRVAGHHNLWSLPFTGLRFSLKPHFYVTSWFFLIAGMMVVGIGLWLHRRRLHVVSRIQALEQRAALISERERIARDMHDDLGSRLTHISLLADLATRSTERPRPERLDELNQAARQAARAVEEIVWAANPGNDTLDRLVSYLIQYTANQLNTAGIACRIDSAIDWPTTEVFPEARQHVFLAFKESINNIIKHARATEVQVSVKPAGKEVVVRITDDGSGFDTRRGFHKEHDGLRNMKARMTTAGGRFSISSQPGVGTVVEMIFPA